MRLKTDLSATLLLENLPNFEKFRKRDRKVFRNGAQRSINCLQNIFNASKRAMQYFVWYERVLELSQLNLFHMLKPKLCRLGWRSKIPRPLLMAF